jgi:NAD(P)-dependent dehydrogenase (short-subunit alcohol dehydrogenase family)
MIEEEWDLVIDTNLKGVFLCSQAAARWMIANGKKGRIINISSINDKIPIAGEAHYCASKGGVVMFTKTLALELAPYGINVNAVSPAGIDTPLMEEALELPELRQAILKQIPRGRFGKPMDVAKAVVFLASEWAEWVTGDVMYVDGGMHLVGEESYVYAFERAMGHGDQLPKVPFCWPVGALEKSEE